MAKLDGKVAVITGGNSGIGLATAKLFYEEGATVVITGRSQEKVDAAVQEIGPNAVGIVSDAGNLQDISALFSDLKQRYGQIDVLFANAGIGKFAPIEMTEESFFDEIMNINFKGVYFAIQQALPLLKDGSSIVINTSVVNVKGMPNASVYSASKAALRSLVRTLATELAARQIRVNAVSPGPIETPIYDKLGLPKEQIDGFATELQKQIVLGRFGKSEEVAKAALFLASDDSSFIDGEEIAVDGGFAQV